MPMRSDLRSSRCWKRCTVSARADARSNVVRGQYGRGTVEGKPVIAYRETSNVNPRSTIETYVALKLMIDNWRWAGVPIYLRTGKSLARRRSEIVIQFKQAPLTLFRDTPVERLVTNDLTLHIQPEEGVTLQFGAKIPGPSMAIGAVRMEFDYRDYFKVAPNTGYETLIHDCMTGDATLFRSADEIEASWRIVEPLLDAWSEDRSADLPVYPAGSSGPAEAAALLAGDGRRWRALDTAGPAGAAQRSLRSRRRSSSSWVSPAPENRRSAVSWRGSSASIFRMATSSIRRQMSRRCMPAFP